MHIENLAQCLLCSKIAIIIICTAIFIYFVLGYCFFHRIKKKTSKGIQEPTKILIVIKVVLLHQGKTWKFRTYTKEKTSQRQWWLEFSSCVINTIV